MGDNLPPGVTPSDIDRAMGPPPDCEFCQDLDGDGHADDCPLNPDNDQEPPQPCMVCRPPDDVSHLPKRDWPFCDVHDMNDYIQKVKRDADRARQEQMDERYRGPDDAQGPFGDSIRGP